VVTFLEQLNLDALRLTESTNAQPMSKRSLSRVMPLPHRRLLTRQQAAEYCGMGSDSFVTNCPVQAKRVRPGQRGLRYDVHDLGAWIDKLGADAEATNPFGDDQWLGKLNGTRKNQGRQSIRKQRHDLCVSSQERDAA
jgi:hypothetical protein